MAMITSRRLLPTIVRLSFGICAALSSFVHCTSGLVPSPPDPKLSCASKEYASQSEQQAQQAAIAGSPALVVVAGRPRINTTEEMKMGQQVTVCVMGLYNWIYVQKKDPTTLRLLVGGHILSMPPSARGPSEQEYLNFVLHLDSADSADWKSWAEIVDASRHSEDNYRLPVSVAVTGSNEVFDSNAFIKIDPYPRRWYYLIALFVLLLGALAYLARTSDLLRYSISAPPSPPLRSPYSLGLVQMAFWFYLVLAAYVYICITSRQVHIPMGSVLGLLGISSTTGLAAIYVDKKKSDNFQTQRSALVAEQNALNARIKDLASNTITAGSAEQTELLGKKSRLAEVDGLIGQLPADPPPASSKGFIRDLLNDGDGVSFHRFQIAIWTIVLGTVFVWSVYRNIVMPEFDASLLTLMGISAGTYIGFKFPEKPKT
jgi:hypothetical protein